MKGWKSSASIPSIYLSHFAYFLSVCVKLLLQFNFFAVILLFDSIKSTSMEIFIHCLLAECWNYYDSQFDCDGQRQNVNILKLMTDYRQTSSVCNCKAVRKYWRNRKGSIRSKRTKQPPWFFAPFLPFSAFCCFLWLGRRGAVDTWGCS